MAFCWISNGQVKASSGGRPVQVQATVLPASPTPADLHALTAPPRRPPPQIFYEVLKDRCVKPDGKRGLVVDVGANFGYFTLYAAKMGCRCGGDRVREGGEGGGCLSGGGQGMVTFS